MAKTDQMQLMPLLKRCIVFNHLDASILGNIAEKMTLRTIDKGAYVFQEQDKCRHFYIVAKGLVKVYVSSTNGTRMTYLMARDSEPLNLIAPFIQTSRPVVAQTLKESVIASLAKDDFLSIAFQYPLIMSNIVAALGQALDSSNSRVIDMMEKKVDERLFRVLFSLYNKFGTPLNFTSLELANLVGTTTESVLRSMGRFKKRGVIDSSRGKIDILNSEALEKYGIESLWI